VQTLGTDRHLAADRVSLRQTDAWRSSSEMRVVAAYRHFQTPPSAVPWITATWALLASLDAADQLRQARGILAACPNSLNVARSDKGRTSQRTRHDGLDSIRLSAALKPVLKAFSARQCQRVDGGLLTLTDRNAPWSSKCDHVLTCSSPSNERFLE